MAKGKGRGGKGGKKPAAQKSAAASATTTDPSAAAAIANEDEDDHYEAAEAEHSSQPDEVELAGVSHEHENGVTEEAEVESHSNNRDSTPDLKPEKEAAAAPANGLSDPGESDVITDGQGDRDHGSDVDTESVVTAPEHFSPRRTSDSSDLYNMDDELEATRTAAISAAAAALPEEHVASSAVELTAAAAETEPAATNPKDEAAHEATQSVQAPKVASSGAQAADPQPAESQESCAVELDTSTTEEPAASTASEASSPQVSPASTTSVTQPSASVPAVSRPEEASSSQASTSGTSRQDEESTWAITRAVVGQLTQRTAALELQLASSILSQSSAHSPNATSASASAEDTDVHMPVAGPHSWYTGSHKTGQMDSVVLSEDAMYGQKHAAAADERARQRARAAAAKRYEAAVAKSPSDYDAWYNWGLVLQVEADSVGAGPALEMQRAMLLQDACVKYAQATQHSPNFHEAHYNWGMALSDLAKLQKNGADAHKLCLQACACYQRAVVLNWNSPQAYNNWGLALQDVATTGPLEQRAEFVAQSITRFRSAIRLRTDFHKAVYNLGTVVYGRAEEMRRGSFSNLTAAELHSIAALYICVAYALKPAHTVYTGALGLVRPLVAWSQLPLPYIKAGFLLAQPLDGILTHEHWRRKWLVLDHESFREARPPKDALVDSSGAFDADQATIPLLDIIAVEPFGDLSLPAGSAFCVSTVLGPQYFVADLDERMDAWVDALKLMSMLSSRRQLGPVQTLLQS
eukprot:jgi/Chlat1/1645/Chrsp127S01902